MYKFVKRAVGVLIAGVALATGVGMTACSNDDETVHLIIGVQNQTGNNYQSMTALLDALSESLNFTYTTVVAGSDTNATLSAYQNALLSGAQGIISMTDDDASMVRSYIELCEEYDAYYAGYMNAMANSVLSEDSSYASDIEYIINSGRFVGSVTDGDTPREGGDRGEFLFNALLNSTDEIKYRNIVLVRNPLTVHPVAEYAVERFIELAAEYNATQATDEDDMFTIYWDSTFDTTGQEVWESYGQTGNVGSYEVATTTTSVDKTILEGWEAAGVDAIVSVNGLAPRFMTSLLEIRTEGSDMVMYSVSWTDATIEIFPEVIKTLTQTPAETIVYPLIRILNAINGLSYDDEPTDVEDTIIYGHYLYITNQEEFDFLRNSCMNFAEEHTYEYSLITVEEVIELMAGSEGATFQKLKDTVEGWTTEALMAAAGAT